MSLRHVRELIFSKSKHLLAIFGILFCPFKLGKFQFGPIWGGGLSKPSNIGLNPKAADRGPLGPRTSLTTEYICVNYL